MNSKIVKDQIHLSIKDWAEKPTWHTGHPLDIRRFHSAILTLHTSLGGGISEVTFRESLRQYASQHVDMTSDSGIAEQIEKYTNKAMTILSFHDIDLDLLEMIGMYLEVISHEMKADKDPTNIFFGAGTMSYYSGLIYNRVIERDFETHDELSDFVKSEVRYLVELKLKGLHGHERQPIKDSTTKFNQEQ